MTRTPVESSNIAEIGYDPETRVLEILFRNGRIYTYNGVPRDEYQALMSADSIGSHFQTHIRPNYTGVRRMEDTA